MWLRGNFEAQRSSSVTIQRPQVKQHAAFLGSWIVRITQLDQFRVWRTSQEFRELRELMSD